jgi:hypothetical protein
MDELKKCHEKLEWEDDEIRQLKNDYKELEGEYSQFSKLYEGFRTHFGVKDKNDVFGIFAALLGELSANLPVSSS